MAIVKDERIVSFWLIRIGVAWGGQRYAQIVKIPQYRHKCLQTTWNARKGTIFWFRLQGPSKISIKVEAKSRRNQESS